MISRREFLALPAALAAAGPERLAVMCQLGSKAETARKVIAAAREAGFRRVMVNFDWTAAEPALVEGLPGWLREAGLACDALGAYVNCVEPAAVLMGTRAQDFARAIAYAGELRCTRLVAWTGSHTPDLMKPDARNWARASEDAIVRFLDPHLGELQRARVRAALETYVTLACPDAPSLARLLRRLPRSIGAVMDPPNLTPVARYDQRDQVMREMFEELRGRIAVVHLKDFRLRDREAGYELPGPLAGEMNYKLYAELIRTLPRETPIVAEHIGPEEFREVREKLLPLFG